MKQISSSSLSEMEAAGGDDTVEQLTFSALHSPASLVTVITKGCSALGDMDLSQPTKLESCRLLTSPWGLGVTAPCQPGVAWDSTPGGWQLNFLHEVWKHGFLLTETRDFIFRLFLAILGR